MSEHGLPSEVLLVLGMHRSGSSALTRVISLLGYSLPKTLIKDNASNRRGHWESQPLARLDDAYLGEAGLVWSDWTSGTLVRMQAAAMRDFEQDLRSLIADEFPAGQPAVIKEPRLCRFVPRIRAALGPDVPTRAIIITRNPLEVIASLMRRNNLTEANAGLLWLRYMLDAVSGSEGLPRAFVAYDQLIADPLTTLSGVERVLGSPYPITLDHVASEVSGFLNGTLQNHASSAEDVVHHDLTGGWISDAYAALRVLTNDPQAPEPLATLARVQREFDLAEPMLGYIVASYDQELDELRRRTAALGASVELKTEQVRILRDAAEEDDARGAAVAFESEIETLQAQVEHERAELRALRRSPSWRITAPLRSLI
ncbi:MAG: hypothetical protein AAF501_12485, partial [Pseudomonadota bacterium]